MKNIPLLLVISISIITYGCSTKKEKSLIHQRLTICNSPDLDSTILCGKYSVFENRQTNDGRKIDLNIVVIPAIHKKQPNAPIFFFDGGPGVAASAQASFFADSINYYRVKHDIVLIDVRGTGDSNPLHCRQLQFKEGLEEQFIEMYPIQDVKDCYDSLSKLADLAQYTTTNMAIDIEEIRKWLGYKTINLFGLSFGGRLAQAYMKMFPTSVESCVLWSPATTYQKMPLYHAQYAEESINKLFEDCKSDSLCNLAFPNLKSEFRNLMERGNRNAFEYKFKSANGKIKEVTIPWYSFHTKIRSLMYAPFGLRQIPFIVHQSYLGNWQPFITLFPSESSYDDFLAEGLYLCVTCAEDVPYIKKQEADSLSFGTFMGDYRVQQQTNACNHWVRGNIPEDFFEPVTSSIPTLLFSGYFDPITSPSMVEQIVQTLPNSFMISIPTMSHTFDGLSNPECFDKMVIDFFNTPGTRPESECISQMLPEKYKTTD
ncbi:MAG TPA: alpha/beta hydrolase [Cyclobacteriaceae bacterium]